MFIEIVLGFFLWLVSLGLSYQKTSKGFSSRFAFFYFLETKMFLAYKLSREHDSQIDLHIH